MEQLPPVIGPLFAQIAATLINFYSGTVVPIADALRALFTTLLMIYLTLWGLAHWRGLIEEPIRDFLMRILKISLVTGIALNTAVYLPQIANRAFELPDQIITLLQPALPAIADIEPNAPAALDRAWQMMMRAADRFMEYSATLGFRSLALAILNIGYSFALTSLAIVVVAIGAGIMLIAKVSLAVLLALGPLFIVPLLFEATRNLFSGWLGQVLTAMLTYVFAGAVVFLIASGSIRELELALTATPRGAIPAISQFLSFMLFAAAGTYLLIQVPALASGVASGIQITTLGMVGDARVAALRALRAYNRPQLAGRGRRNLLQRLPHRGGAR